MNFIKLRWLLISMMGFNFQCDLSVEYNKFNLNVNTYQKNAIRYFVWALSLFYFVHIPNLQLSLLEWHGCCHCCFCVFIPFFLLLFLHLFCCPTWLIFIVRKTRELFLSCFEASSFKCCYAYAFMTWNSCTHFWCIRYSRLISDCWCNSVCATVCEPHANTTKSKCWKKKENERSKVEKMKINTFYR